MAKKEYPSRMWELEQRIKVAWKNRKHPAIKDPASDSAKMSAVTVGMGILTSVAYKAPVIGVFMTQVFSGFLALPIMALTAVPAWMTFKNVKNTLYNDQMDKVMEKKIEQWRKNPDRRSFLGKTIGKGFGLALKGLRLAGAVAAVAGVTVAAAAGIAAFGGAALAGTAVMGAATQVLGVATAALGFANPIALLATGLASTAVGTGVAWKGEKTVYKWGQSLKNSMQLSEQGKKETAGFFGRVANGIRGMTVGFAADVFNTAAERQAQKAAETLKNKVAPKKPKQQQNTQ